MDGLPLHSYPQRQLHNFSPDWVPGKAVKETIRRQPHVVNLHWVVQGFVHIDALSALNCPIVWTLHDSWPFTGGCHLPGACRRYEQSCGHCPVLGSHVENDWSRRIWQRKQASWKDLSLTVVAPSRWLADRARASSLFAHRRIEVIPNGIDTALYSPGDSQAARRALGLPENRRLLLFGANHSLSDANKGFDLLRTALNSLGEDQRQDTELVIFGETSDRPIPDCGLPVRNLGPIADEDRIVLLYRSADLFVSPSRQENLPNMVLEAMACGTPCVAFKVGGMTDMIDHQHNGYLGQPYDTDDLARGIAWVLKEKVCHGELSRNARRKAEAEFDMKRVTACYKALYEELVHAKEGKIE
jgi:glycosyltransferase involved in cell wall biosynthesis